MWLGLCACCLLCPVAAASYLASATCCWASPAHLSALSGGQESDLNNLACLLAAAWLWASVTFGLHTLGLGICVRGPELHNQACLLAAAHDGACILLLSLTCKAL